MPAVAIELLSKLSEVIVVLALSTSAHASASLSTMLQLTISTVSILRVRSDVAANASISFNRSSAFARIHSALPVVTYVVTSPR